ncbi:FkbM family methyltransferase [Bacillus sp. DX1.1]|uniref:FkbM family methyltransferase n=1 Tax=unclassified Bacillus (in: firmicutes) TaxID=185979 RepID=UPI00256FEC70|nr:MULTISPECIES: FkbM family methyltransferase [unclassified Bacillus (in: firmicutes)]MDM5157399.1 FkbM family methyltransferase [Bacillus sp. DX1.1]WJE81623.1 FkbM family methyltransferase [Bacillus sp. DX3.1]
MTKTLDITLKDDNIIRVFDDYIGRIISSTKDYYEKEALEYFSDYIPENGVIYDIGANIGNHTVYFTKCFNPKKVYAFEPAEKIYEILKYNIKVNGLENLETFNYAVGEKSGKASLNYNQENTGASNIQLNKNGEIKVVSLDDLNLEEPDLIKVDVEGLEYEVIKGMVNHLNNASPVLWVEIFSEHYPKVDELLSSMNYIQVDRYLDNYVYIKPKNYADLENIANTFKSKPLRRFTNRIQELNFKYRNVTEGMQKLKNEISKVEKNYNQIKGINGNLENKLALLNADNEALKEKLKLLKVVEENEKELKVEKLNKQHIKEKNELLNEITELKAKSTFLLDVMEKDKKETEIRFHHLKNIEDSLTKKIEALIQKEDRHADKYLSLLAEKEEKIKLLEGNYAKVEEKSGLDEEKLVTIKKKLHITKEENERLAVEKINLEAELQQAIIDNICLLNKEEELLSKIENEVVLEREKLMDSCRKLEKRNQELSNNYQNLQEARDAIAINYNSLQKEYEQLFKASQKIEYDRKVINFTYEALQKEHEHLVQNYNNLQSENRVLLKDLKDYKQKYEKIKGKYTALKNSRLGKLTLKYWGLLKGYKDSKEQETKK